jgi:hypothetical protein
LPRFLATPHQAAALHAVASAYHVRPSEILRGQWVDWQIDLTVLLLATQPDAAPVPKSTAVTTLMHAHPHLVRKMA